jgi:hypothetical protein
MVERRQAGRRPHYAARLAESSGHRITIMVLCGVILDILFAKALVRQNGANLLRKGATKAKQEGLYTFLRNEPTEFALENMGYQSGQQVVMEEIRERKRWVRFGKRTHREGVK